MTTININCKKCGRVHIFKGPNAFRCTMSAWADVYGLFHAIRHHWCRLTPKARFWAPFYVITRPLLLILALAWDLLCIVLLIITWPFWWLHEEVL